MNNDKIFDVTTLCVPIVQINNEVNTISIMRDDLLPFSFGGNKVRIAMEFINDMRKKNKNCIIGYGNARSNLSRALANICYQYDIPCYIVSPSDDDGKHINTFNSEIVKFCEAKFCYCNKSNVKTTIEGIIEEIKENGYAPYYIYGDSLGKGNEHIPVKAYRKVYEIIKGQYDYIFLATGTGMTQAGLLAGMSVNCGKEKIVGISVARSSEQEKAIIEDMLNAYSKRVEKIDVNGIEVSDLYLAEGYGKYNDEIETVIRNNMIINGIPLDPTYTGKAFWGMESYIRNNCIKGKKILFIHTGGTPLFFDWLDKKLLFDNKL